MSTVVSSCKPGLASYSIAKASSWTIDTNSSEAAFTIKSLGLHINGSFKGIKGVVFFDDTGSACNTISASIDVSTLNTGLAIRTKDLLHAKYFDEQKYPQITFRSENITTLGSGYKASGILIMKGNWRQNTIPFMFTQNGKTGVFKSKFFLNRLDFDIGGKSAIIANTVKVTLKVVAIKNEAF